MLSHPFAFEVLVSSRISDLLSEATHDYLVALAGSAGPRQSPLASQASLLKSVWSQILAPASGAVGSRPAASNL